MQIGLKERLIGAVVLVILAVIIIPWVLKGGSAPDTTVTKPLSLPPAATTTAAPAYRMDLSNPSAPVQTAGTASGVAPATATTQIAPPGAVSAAGASASQAVEQPAAAAAFKSVARPAPAPATHVITHGKWVVQAGSYGNEANARSVERRLAKHGYHAYLNRYHKGDRTYYRVRVGPYADRAAAERIVHAVARAYGGRAEVVPNS